jgi:plastocyanin
MWSRQILRATGWVAILALSQLGALSPSPAAAQGQKRFFTIAAVEPKGGTTADKEPFPAANLPEGNGYILKKPDQTGRWEVSTYVWQPSQIIVNEGDEVTLEFVGINGAEHPTTIVGYDKTLVLKRGHVIRIELKADKAGTFPIICSHHKPSMVGELIVMPAK